MIHKPIKKSFCEGHNTQENCKSECLSFEPTLHFNKEIHKKGILLNKYRKIPNKIKLENLWFSYFIQCLYMSYMLLFIMKYTYKYRNT